MREYGHFPKYRKSMGLGVVDTKKGSSDKQT